MFTEGTSVWLDVHARSVAAAATDGVTGELVQTKLTPSYEHIRSWLGALPGPVAVAYEAGPTGFGLYRSLTSAGIRCEVAAPSKLQKPSGDRVKTDAMDASHLARLLRHGIVYFGGDAWTGKHDQWLCQEALPQLRARATRMTFDSDYEALLAARGRRGRLDVETEELAANSEFTPLVRRLGCLRGVSTLTGFALAVEIGDWHRFTGNSIGSFVGLVPSEYSSGTSRSQGSITKTGVRPLRRPTGWWQREERPATVL